MRLNAAWLSLLLIGCGGGGDDPGSDDAGPDGTDAEIVALDAAPREDAQPPLTLTAVAGDLTYTELDGDGVGHIYAVQIDGQLRQRITSEPARWGVHAVSPDPRFVVAVRRETEGGLRAIWIIDVRSQQSWAISPPDCDAGIGGVGWRDEVQVVFAMQCGDEVSQAYLANRENRSRARENLLAVTAHDKPVRDVFTAVNSPIFAYTVDADSCETGACFTKPQVWIGLTDPPGVMPCPLTDGDPEFVDTSTITGLERRIGDHAPSFTRDLTSVAFSRNVGGKPRGPEGHHDLLRVGFVARALFAGDGRTCATGGVTNLSTALFDDTLTDATGARVAGDERYPSASAGRAPVGGLLFTGQTHAAGGRSAIYFVDLQGTVRAITPESGHALHGRWIVTEFDTSGERD